MSIGCAVASVAAPEAATEDVMIVASSYCVWMHLLVLREQGAEDRELSVFGLVAHYYDYCDK